MSDSEDTKFVIGGQVHLVPKLSLRASRLAFKLIPAAYESRDPDVLFDAFVKILVANCPGQFTEDMINDNVRGADEVVMLMSSMAELMKTSGFDSGEGETSPMGQAMKILMNSSTGSSSPSDEKDSKGEAGT